MKRSAAILGPTPPFLRWTIAVPCQFRDPEAKNLTNAAFQELRSLRAISVAEIEDRIVDGICIHPDVASAGISDAKGFPVGEVYAAFGGKENAENACRSCPANVPVSTDELSGDPVHSKAGCFGWLPFGEDENLSPGFMSLMESGESSSDSIVELFEAALKLDKDSSQPGSSQFPETNPGWYGVWSQKQFSGPQLEMLVRVLAKVDSPSIAWKRLATAVQVSLEHDLDFRVDLTPAGFSDGVWWKIESSCATCGVSKAQQPCKVCGSKAAPNRERKTRVLGMRPYLNLVSILGEESTNSIVERFRQSNAE